MKLFIRILFFIVLAVTIVTLMYKYGLISFDRIFDSFHKHPLELFYAAMFYVPVHFIMLFRYKYITRSFGIKIPTYDLMSATFVSNAIGQLTPGSLVITEIFRMGLMFGADKKNNLANKTSSIVQVKSTASSSKFGARLAMSSIFDRCIGFFVILSIGAISSFSIFITRYNHGVVDSLTKLIFWLGAFWFLGAFAIASIPFVFRLNILWKIVKKIEDRITQNKTKKPSPFLVKVFTQAENVRVLVMHKKTNYNRIIITTLLSIASLVCVSLGLYFGAISIGYDNLSLIAIASAYPAMALSEIFPLGFAGMGGYQLVAIAIFSVFQLDANAVGSAKLLVNALFFIQIICLGLIFASASMKQIKAIIKNKKNLQESVV